MGRRPSSEASSLAVRSRAQRARAHLAVREAHEHVRRVVPRGGVDLGVELVRRELASPTVAGHTGEGPANDDITDLVISVLVAEDQVRTDPSVFVFDSTANRASAAPIGGSEICGSTPVKG